MKKILNEKNDFIPADQWFPIMLEMLNDDKHLKISPHGFSMYPFLISDRDEVILKLPDRPFKKGDIILYRRDNGLYVLHRIHHINNNEYYMIGDSQTGIEGPLKREQLLAIADSIIRKHKLISCSNRKYCFLSMFWLKIRPIRPVIIHIWLFIRKMLVDKKFLTR